VPTSTNYQPKLICLKENDVAAVYDKTWYTGIVQNVDQEQVDTSIQFVHPNGFSSFVLATKRSFLLGTNAAIALLKAIWLKSAQLLL